MGIQRRTLLQDPAHHEASSCHRCSSWPRLQATGLDPGDCNATAICTQMSPLPPVEATWNLRQCSLPPTMDLNSKSGLGITTHPTFPARRAEGTFGTRLTTWELATASPTWRRDSTDAGTPPAWETSCAMDAERRVFQFLSKYKNKK